MKFVVSKDTLVFEDGEKFENIAVIYSDIFGVIAFEEKCAQFHKRYEELNDIWKHKNSVLLEEDLHYIEMNEKGLSLQEVCVYLNFMLSKARNNDLIKEMHKADTSSLKKHIYKMRYATE